MLTLIRSSMFDYSIAFADRLVEKRATKTVERDFIFTKL